MEQRELSRIAREFGTPSFVFDVGAFRARLRAVRDIVGDEVGLCYAVKANPFLAAVAAEELDKLEVCSPGELDICRAMGVDPAKIVFSGVNKTGESVREAVEAGVGVLTAESLKHVALIEAEGARSGRSLDVLVRLNAGSQFGMSREDLQAVVEGRSEYPHLNIVGLHYFVGTQRMKLSHQRRELEKLAKLIDGLAESSRFEVERLEYGPGLGVPLFEGDDFSDTLAPMRELADALQSMAARVQLTVEMGRFFATECGTYLTAVNDLKSNEGVSYCIVDGGINHVAYVGQVMGMKTPAIANLGACDRGVVEPVREWCVCGSLCTTNDVLARVAALPDVREGDVLAFSNCGAYSVTEGVYLFLSRTMPRIIMRNADGSVDLARDFVETSRLNMMAG